jgi:hypothetical protein
MADPQGAKMRAESLSNKHVHEHQLTEAEQKVMEKFETLDYDVCENTLYRERKRNYSEAEERTRNLMYWCALSASAHSQPRSQRPLDERP